MEKSFWRQHRYWLVSLALLLGTALPAQAQVRFTNVAQLVSATIPAGMSGQQAIVSGRLTANDGGGGIFVYDSSSAASTNLGTIFKPSASNGRWLRQYSGALDIRWFGATDDGTANDFGAIQNAINTGVLGPDNSIYVPAGSYAISSALTNVNELVVWGDGYEASIVEQDTSGLPVFNLTDVSNFALNDLQLVGNNTNVVEITATGSDVYYPRIARCKLLNMGANSAGILIQPTTATFPVYFPSIEDCVIYGNGASPNVTTNSVGVKFYGTGATTITVGPRMFGTRIYNVQEGVQMARVDTISSFGLILDGIQTTGGSGIGLHFVSAGTCNFYGTRIEGGAIDTYLQFDAASADNYVAATLGNATSAQVVDNGTRNSWEGSDGSGGLVNVLNGPGYFARGRFLIANTGLMATNKLGLGITPTAILHVSTNNNGDPVLAHFQNLSAGTAAETAVYVSNEGTAASALILEATGTGFTTTGAFVQDSGVLMSGTGLSGGLSVGTRASSPVRFYTSGHTNERMRITPSGGVNIGDTSDTASGVLSTSGSISSGGNVIMRTAGNGLQVKEGSNARMGTAALVNGTVTVANTSVTANTRIFLTRAVEAGTTVGILGVGAVVAATSFVIESVDLAGALSADDDSTVNWLLIEPSP